MATDPRPTPPADPTKVKPVSARGRQAGDYEAPVEVEPKGGPIPEHQPFDTTDAASR